MPLFFMPWILPHFVFFVERGEEFGAGVSFGRVERVDRVEGVSGEG